MLPLFLCNLLTFAQNSDGYPELQLYQRTLDAENADSAYHKAFTVYQKEGTKKTITTNKLLDKRYHEIINLPQNNDNQLLIKINRLQELSMNANGEGEINLELEALTRSFSLAFWSVPCNYGKAFTIAIALEKRLSTVEESHYPDKRTSYFMLGEAYYLFRDFDKSISLLQKAITEKPPRSFTDCASLNARKIIGICYANKGKMDISDYYFKSILKSKDIVLNRPVQNAVALSNLGCNAMLKGEYDKAISLDLAVLPFLKQGDDYGHIAGMYACQCQSYFSKNNFAQMGMVVDSILFYANKDQYNRNKRLKQAYSILAKYHVTTGDIEKVQEYNDSLVAIYKREETLFSSQYILQAQQEAGTKELQIRNEQIKAEHNRFVAGLILSIISILALSVIFYLYRRKQTAFRLLVEKNRQWAQQATDDVIGKEQEEYSDKTMIHHKPTKEEMQIMEQIKTFILADKNYKNPDLTMELLASKLHINRKYISSAINKVTGKNFNTYINEYRIQEAIRILSSPEHNIITIDGVAEMVGFNNRKSFYEYFKKITGLTPSHFRKK
ncbi:helix-turn-helix protein [Dysgonomonas alginatilytica]|uniref:Helix-turn-helix protein n=2 Tax=Dysgonomonas alginatilytica TaxID=1605892 RepID=A0A2V3PT08_9BACT|nr:helix-turn-helix protein [Dysgonomonas alginatilytica]